METVIQSKMVKEVKIFGVLYRVTIDFSIYKIDMHMNRDYEFEDSVDFARYLVGYLNERGIYSMNITKLQKLLYIAYGLYLAVKNKRLIKEHPQAWPYGPVFPRVRKKLLNVDLDSLGLDDSIFNGNIDLKRNVNLLLDSVYTSFGDWSASQLTAWSHKPNTPWSIATEEDDFKWGIEIRDDIIKKYFNNMLAVK